MSHLSLLVTANIKEGVYLPTHMHTKVSKSMHAPTGLLPILKELIEILFQEGLLKV